MASVSCSNVLCYSKHQKICYMYLVACCILQLAESGSQSHRPGCRAVFTCGTEAHDRIATHPASRLQHLKFVCAAGINNFVLEQMIVLVESVRCGSSDAVASQAMPSTKALLAILCVYLRRRERGPRPDTSCRRSDSRASGGESTA